MCPGWALAVSEVEGDPSAQDMSQRTGFPRDVWPLVLIRGHPDGEVRSRQGSLEPEQGTTASRCSLLGPPRSSCPGEQGVGVTAPRIQASFGADEKVLELAEVVGAQRSECTKCH